MSLPNPSATLPVHKAPVLKRRSPTRECRRRRIFCDAKLSPLSQGRLRKSMASEKREKEKEMKEEKEKERKERKEEEERRESKESWEKSWDRDSLDLGHRTKAPDLLVLHVPNSWMP